MSKLTTATLCLFALAIASSAVAAPGEEVLYMWTDADGVTTFSQTRPRDRSAVEIDKPYAVTPPPAPPAAEIQEVAELHSQNERTRALNCSIGQRTLDKLSAHKNIYLIGEDGLFHMISEERRAQEVARAQQIIAEWCEAAP